MDLTDGEIAELHSIDKVLHFRACNPEVRALGRVSPSLTIDVYISGLAMVILVSRIALLQRLVHEGCEKYEAKCFIRNQTIEGFTNVSKDNLLSCID